MVQKTIDILIGETGSGKTEYIEKIYINKPFEVINCDSRQIYKELDIGTAKPSAGLLDRIKHHFIDVIDISENYDVMDFVNRANELLEGKGDFLISAGTPFYLNILINGISPIPAISETVKEQLRKEYREKGLADLYRELMEKDRERAEELEVNDSQRIIRALEVVRETGKPISFFYKTIIKPNIKPGSVIYIKRSREMLKKRVEHRTHQMIQNGLIDETKSIIDKYGIDVLRQKKIIGYTESIMCLDNEISVAEAETLIVKNTMQYIKHQRTFFNKILKTLPKTCTIQYQT